MRVIRFLGTAAAALFAVSASAQNLPYPLQNAAGPTGNARQVNYPYPGQCQADPAGAVIWTTTNCDATLSAKSFACALNSNGRSNQTAASWRSCSGTTAVPKYIPLLPVAPSDGVTPALTDATPKFVWEALNPLDYTKDTTTYPGAEYYEIGIHESWGFQGIASVPPGENIPAASLDTRDVVGALFPNPLQGTCRDIPATCDAVVFGALGVPAGCGQCNRTYPGAPAVPNGMQWTGLVCNATGGCTCPAEVTLGAYCVNGVGAIPRGMPIYTPIHGVGQINKGGGPITTALNTAAGGTLGTVYVAGGSTTTAWSNNDYVATWPSISIRGTRDVPVVVKWVNEFPNNHLFCPHPEAADWPCAIDRTFMGVRPKIDPASSGPSLVSPEGMNQFGGPQQPDNSWVTHLHGGYIPPTTDGFAEKWFGNKVTGAQYTPAADGWWVSPAFDGPGIAVKRPGGSPAGNDLRSWMYDTYTYPMKDQEEALIWFHDHTLGKTHHNVIAGPAGFFPVKDNTKHGAVTAGVCGGANGTCAYTWLDPVTEPRGSLGIPKYDFFFALQDRSFNDDGSINFSNFLGQAGITGPGGQTTFTPGDNPEVHPVWLPEYFGDHMLVNGVLWPKKTVGKGWYRIRMADGSDSRCYTIGFQVDGNGGPAPGTVPNPNKTFYVLAGDQGYLSQPRAATEYSFCPGERVELLIDFTGVTQPVYMTNSAAAPYPGGTPITGPGNEHMNVIMRFDPSNNITAVPTCLGGASDFTWPTAGAGCLISPAGNFGLTGTDPNFVDYRATLFNNPYTTALTPKLCSAGGVVGSTCISAVRQLYLNERADGITDTPMGMQINGVPFEYKVTETPVNGTIELWKIINLTVDAHPMHPHLVKHQKVAIQQLNVGEYKRALCGSTTCQPGTAPGGEMQFIPDVDSQPFLVPMVIGSPIPVGQADLSGGWKDASIVLPGYVTWLIAKWDGVWTSTAPNGTTSFASPGTTPPLNVAAPLGPTTCGLDNTQPGCDATKWTHDAVTVGPFVWHCHINSHEDSEMMRTSLVVP